MELDFGQFTTRLLSEVPNLAEECCLLLNHEWKRSIEARMRSINKENDRYPLNIVLVHEHTKKEKLIIAGHCRVSVIPPPDDHGPAVFLESVVISPELRGKGLGRHLISEVELYLRKRGVRSIYLYTMGQEAFYRKVGYTPCQPVDVFGTVPDLMPQDPPQPVSVRRRSYIGQNGKMPKPLPPTPPPPPRIPANERSFYKGSKSFMHKNIFPTGSYK